MVARVVALGGAGAAKAGPWVVVAAPRGADRCEWGLGAGEARWRSGERESRGRECLAGGERERWRSWDRATPWGEPGQ